MINWKELVQMMNNSFDTDYKNPKEMLNDLYWNEGHTTLEIAREFCITSQSVINKMKKLNISRREKGWRDNDPRLFKYKFLVIPKERMKTMTAKEIGKKIKCHSFYVWHLAKKTNREYKKIGERKIKGEINGRRSN